MRNMREKVSRRCEAAPTLQRSAVRGRLSSTSAHNQTKYMDEAKPRTGNLPSVRPLPLFVAIARQAQILENFPSSLSNLRNGGNNFSGERRDRGSTLLPWKYDKVEEGCDVLRWQYTCFNRRLCQYRGLSPKQKQFCSLWNTFLWAEVIFHSLIRDILLLNG